ncbi:MAG TPA: methyltransferase [Nitrososphaeraceae archaeon]|jgi:predicted transcriptional regulator/ubiquinone/menaquinone biosynthesis C-methylase UbiE
MSDYEKTLDLIFGRWRSQILYVGVELGVFEYVSSKPKNASEIAKALNLDYNLAYRLLRALGSLGLLREGVNRDFIITPQGEFLRKDNPKTLRGIALLEEGPEHYALWKHLPAMIKGGKQNAFPREYGQKLFEFTDSNPPYREVFNQAMSSYSSIQTSWVTDALDGYDFSNVNTVCDVGGGQGHLLCSLLVKYPHLKGTVLELNSVIKNKELLWAEKMGLKDRCSYVSGNMFNEIPEADAYIMKMILHDWSDDECVKILSNMYTVSARNGRVLIAEHLVPEPDEPHFSKLFDIHMMCVATGKERTVQEYADLLKRTGWNHANTFHSRSGLMGVIEGKK